MASDFAIKNFEDIERTGSDGVDGRFSRKFLDSTELGVSRWRYEPGMRTAGHRHQVQEEVYTVISGSGRLKLDDEVIEIKQWDVIRVAPQVARGFRGRRGRPRDHRRRRQQAGGRRRGARRGPLARRLAGSST